MKIPSEKEVIYYLHKKLAKRKYKLKILDDPTAFAVDVKLKIMGFSPRDLLALVKHIMSRTKEQEFTWKDFIDYYVAHEFGHEKISPVIKSSGYESEDFDFGVGVAEDYLIDSKLPKKLRKILKIIARFALLEVYREKYKTERSPLDLSFMECGAFASCILRKEITLNEIKPYLSQKSLWLVEEWKKILKKIVDVNSLLLALEDVENLYCEYIHTLSLFG